MRIFCFLVVVLLLSHLRAGEAPPNIVLIVSDDHAWTDYGFMGHPHIKTPNLDRLAGESLTFTRGYVTSSLCCPSLASIITGRQPHRHKITSNDPPRPPSGSKEELQKIFLEGRERMNRHLEAVPTLPTILKQQGYLSLQTGKWWQGHFSRGGFTHGMTNGGRHGDAGLETAVKPCSRLPTSSPPPQPRRNPSWCGMRRSCPTIHTRRHNVCSTSTCR